LASILTLLLFTYTASSEIYSLSLHDALPICAVPFEVREGAGVIVGFDRDVLDADMLLMVLVGNNGRHVELHTVQVELAAAAGNFPLHGRAEIVHVELGDLLRILSGLDVDVSELHGHTRLLPLGFTKGRRGGACLSQLGSASIGTQPAFARFPALSGVGFRPYRCWVTASINAGLPVLTCAIARSSAGSRSSAFSIGPSAHQPIERARPAKSGVGPNRSMPIWARLRSVPRVRAITI